MPLDRNQPGAAARRVRHWAPAVITGVLVGVLAGGAWVGAHGGDAGQVHGCVKPEDAAAGRPNVIIVEADAACPSGYNPKDWAVQGPQGAPGETGPRGPDGAASDPQPPRFTEIAAQSGVRITKRVKILKTSSPLDFSPIKGFPKPIATPPCPASHPKVVAGGYETAGFGPDFPAEAFSVVLNERFADEWRVAAAISVDKLGPQAGDALPHWQLTAYIVCLKK